MSNSSSNTKRGASDAPISPPPLKRKLQSGTTKSAVANFFTPASQKPKDNPVVWSERSSNSDTPATLLVGRYGDATDEPPNKRRKIAAFDFDSTLIKTRSGKKHASDGADWLWWHPTVPGRLRELYQQDDYRVVILSNQGGLALHQDPKAKGPKGSSQNSSQNRVNNFKQKCSAVLSSLGLPTTIYAATEKDMYRKPRPGMWNEMLDDYDIDPSQVDFANSIFIGDAGGRTAGKDAKGSAYAKDFSCSDRNLAHNIGIQFKTPEEFFLKEDPRVFVRDFDLAHYPYQEVEKNGIVYEKKNEQDIVIFVGPPGVGKSTFFWTFLQPLGYERINQDILKTRGRCEQVALEKLSEAKSVAIDATNANVDTRNIWIEMARKKNIPARCVWFQVPAYVAEHNDAVRSLNKELNPESREVLPRVAFTGYAGRYQEPKMKEGFQDITVVPFRFRGTKAEYDIWARYWT